MKALVTFYSKTGTTARVAGIIGEKLASEGVDVTVKPLKCAREPGFLSGVLQSLLSWRPALSETIADVGEYDIVFFGFPVWAGRPASPINSFLHGLKNAGGRSFAPFATCEAKLGYTGPLKGVSEQVEKMGGVVLATGGFQRGLLQKDQDPAREFAESALGAATSK